MRAARCTKSTVEGDIQYHGPLFIRHIDYIGRATQASIVHQHVDVTHSVDGLGEQILNLVFLGNVAKKGVGLFTAYGFESVCGFSQAPLVDVADDDFGSLFSASFGNGEADTGSGRGGDQDGFTGEEVFAFRVAGDGFRQVLLPQVLGCGLGSRGSPSARSPMILRWIWFDPA